MAFGTAWREGMYHDGNGLCHRPDPTATPTRRCTAAERERLALLIRESEDLGGRLRYKLFRGATLDRRILALCGRVEVRSLRRVWLQRQAYLLDERRA